MKTKHTFYDHLYAWMPKDMPIEERTSELLEAAAIHIATMLDDFNYTRDAGVECGKEYYDTMEKRLDEYRTRLFDMLELTREIEQQLPEKPKDPYRETAEWVYGEILYERIEPARCEIANAATDIGLALMLLYAHAGNTSVVSKHDQKMLKKLFKSLKVLKLETLRDVLHKVELLEDKINDWEYAREQESLERMAEEDEGERLRGRDVE